MDVSETVPSQMCVSRRGRLLGGVAAGTAVVAILCAALVRGHQKIDSVEPTSHGSEVTAVTSSRSRAGLTNAGTENRTAAQLQRALNERLISLETAVTRISDQQSALSRELGYLALAQVPDTVNNTSLGEQELAEMTHEEQVLEAETQIQEHADHLDWMAQSESVDVGWASEAQTAFYESFGAEELEGFEVASADCRTTFCRVELSIDPDTAAEDHYRSIVHGAPWNGAGFVRLTDDPPQATLYLAREGEALPDLSAEP